jgi:hypothetical protein
MTEALSPAVAEEEISTNGEVHKPNPELTRVIQARVVQGYRVESLSETRAVLVVKGRKRFLGLRHGDDQKTELTMGEHGRVVTRNL